MKNMLRYCLYGMLLFVLVAMAFMCSFRNTESYGKLRLMNESGEQIAEIKIEICNNKVYFWDLPIGCSVGFNYPVEKESSYNINVRFASGRILISQLGYVTDSAYAENSDEVVITFDEIQLMNKGVVLPQN